MRNLLRPTLPLLLILLSACATLGLQSADTFNKKAAYTYAGVDAVMQTVTTSVFDKSLSPEAAQTAIDKAHEITAAVDTARSIAGAGNLADANNRLAAATIALTALKSYVDQHKASP